MPQLNLENQGSKVIAKKTTTIKSKKQTNQKKSRKQ